MPKELNVGGMDLVEFCFQILQILNPVAAD